MRSGSFLSETFFRNGLCTVIFSFFALAPFTIPALHQFVDFFTQTRFFTPDPVAGSMGLLAYWAMALLVLIACFVSGVFLLLNGQKKTALFSLKLAASLCGGVSAAWFWPL